VAIGQAYGSMLGRDSCKWIDLGLDCRLSSARIDALLTEYAKAPKLTRERLYLETMERILPRVRLYVVDPGGDPEGMRLRIVEPGTTP